MASLVIHKYPFEVALAVGIDLPAGARILDVQVQDGRPCLWALVDPVAPAVREAFAIYSTGHAIDPGALMSLEYVKTFQYGLLVWHMFRHTL